MFVVITINGSEKCIRLFGVRDLLEDPVGSR